MRIAITGGTGFVGRHVIDLALAKAHHIVSLARSPQPPRPGLRWVEGAIDPPRSLASLVEGADAVIHIAGAINASSRAAFAACNSDGTAAVVAAASAAGVRRFVHVSSLAAREPALSDYGWSKSEAERRVEASTLDWTIVRPPAVYGPGDREMLALFRMASRGIVVLPPEGRLSLIAVQDLARLLIACAETPDAAKTIYEADDGAARGYSHTEFAKALSVAVGRTVLPVAVPQPVLRAASLIERVFKRGSAKLTQDRVRYFCHPDWVVRRSMAPPAKLWEPGIDATSGLKATANAYREAGWL